MFVCGCVGGCTYREGVFSGVYASCVGGWVCVCVHVWVWVGGCGFACVFVCSVVCHVLVTISSITDEY